MAAVCYVYQLHETSMTMKTAV